MSPNNRAIVHMDDLKSPVKFAAAELWRWTIDFLVPKPVSKLFFLKSGGI